MGRAVRTYIDTLRANFFFLPTVAVVIAFVVARISVGIDAGGWVGESTVDSARAVLSTVAAATITFASISFSVALLIMQQGSSQFSPRVIHGLTRDPFNRRVIAVVLGTFTYCLVTLQRVRGLEDEREDIVPHTAVAIGLVLGIVAVLSIVAAMHHTSRQMDVSTILQRIVDESRRARSEADVDGLRPVAGPVPPPPGAAATEVRVDADGWVRDIDVAALARLTVAGGVVTVATAPGRYAIPGSLLCTISPAVDDGDADDVGKRARDAVRVGPTRTMTQDPGYAVRQLVDVALRAISPGVNDPTTALDAIFHLGTVLVERYGDDPPASAYEDDEGRRVALPHALDDDGLAELAIAELRQASAELPVVSVYLLEMIGAVVAAATARGHAARARPLLDEAALIVDQAAATKSLLEPDRLRIQHAYAQLP